MPFIDLTHTFNQNMPVYPGDPKPEIRHIAHISEHGYNDFEITTGMHVGTHIDAPFHMLANGKQLHEYPVDHFVGKGHVIDARDRAIDAELLNEKNISKGDIVLVLTGFSAKYNSPEYFESYPEIGESFAKKLIELGVSMVGMDMCSPDRPPFAIHKLLLKHDVLIIENLTNLEKLLECKTFNIIALPAKFHADAAPARVIAQL